MKRVGKLTINPRGFVFAFCSCVAIVILATFSSSQKVTRYAHTTRRFKLQERGIALYRYLTNTIVIPSSRHSLFSSSSHQSQLSKFREQVEAEQITLNVVEQEANQRPDVIGMSDHRKRQTFSPVPFATFATLASHHSQWTDETGRTSSLIGGRIDARTSLDAPLPSSAEAGCRRNFGREVM